MPNYKSHTSEGDCIFCQITSGKMPPLGGGLFREDEDHMARLSPFPNTEGFSVITPKKHYGSDVLAMPDKELQAFVLAAKKVAKILEKHFEDVGRVGLMMEGTGIDHAHIKLFPMHGTGYMKTGERRQHPSGIETSFEKYEGYMISNDGPRADDEKIQNLAAELRKISQ